MKNYLMKIKSINQNITDPSEFYTFKSAVKQYLKTDNDHSKFIKSLIDSLKIIKKKRIIACIISISALLNVKTSFIPIKYLRKYIKSLKIRDSVVEYLNAFNIDKFDHLIEKIIVKDNDFQSESFFEYMKTREKLTTKFLANKNPNLLYKQFNLMINCKIFSEILYYVQFLGDNSALLCFKAFETFLIFFDEIKNKKIEHKSVIKANEDFYLNIEKNSLFISNPFNFIRFGWLFLPEKIEIENCVNNNDFLRLKEIVNNYSSNNPVFNIEIFDKSMLYHNLIFQNQIETESIDLDQMIFDHLFEDNYKKDICDCYEI